MIELFIEPNWTESIQVNLRRTWKRTKPAGESRDAWSGIHHRDHERWLTPPVRLTVEWLVCAGWSPPAANRRPCRCWTPAYRHLGWTNWKILQKLFTHWVHSIPHSKKKTQQKPFVVHFDPFQWKSWQKICHFDTRLIRFRFKRFENFPQLQIQNFCDLFQPNWWQS